MLKKCSILHFWQMKRDEETLKRELSALESVYDHYPKYLLTMDIDPEVDYNNGLDWLLDETK